MLGCHQIALDSDILPLNCGHIRSHLWHVYLYRISIGRCEAIQGPSGVPHALVGVCPPPRAVSTPSRWSWIKFSLFNFHTWIIFKYNIIFIIYKNYKFPNKCGTNFLSFTNTLHHNDQTLQFLLIESIQRVFNHPDRRSIITLNSKQAAIEKTLSLHQTISD